MIHLDVLAGKMSFDGKKVSPDPRKGILRLLIDAAADSVRLQWLDRSAEPAVVENEWVAPVTIEAVPSAKTGKVYVLKPESGEKQFVWIQQQSSNAAGDAAGFASGQVDNLEALINQIQMFSQMRSGKDAAEMHAQIFEEDHVQDDQMLVDLGQHHHDDDDDDEDGEAEDEEFQALMEQLVAGMGEDGVSELGPEQIAVLLMMHPEVQQALVAHWIELAAAYVASKPELAQQLAVAQPSVAVPEASSNKAPVNVASILQSEEAISVLTKEEETRRQLLELCPEGESDVAAILRSPQFGEALRALNEGIYSDQISLLFASLGLDTAQLANAADPFVALCKALENKFRHQ